ncbi:MAG: GTP cyclohydrolase II, partial [Bdellovibrionales bacterium]
MLENESKTKRSNHIILASHANLKFKETLPVHWGAKTPMERGPIVASNTNTKARNAIGGHGGSYTVYRALSIASGKFPSLHKPDLHNTQSPVKIGPYPQWFDPKKMVAVDPWGLDPQSHFQAHYDKGYDIRPTIAMTQAHLQIPELNEAIKLGRLKVDG